MISKNNSIDKQGVYVMLGNITFKSKIDGKQLKDYKYKINWNIKDLDIRRKAINNILNLNEYGMSEDTFWQEIWDCGVCKAILGKSDTRWEETDVAHFLEVMGSYLLYSYNKKEKKRNKDLELKDELGCEEVVNDSNYRLAPPEKISASDYVMRDLFKGTYEEYVNKVKPTGYEIKEEESFNRIKHNEEEKIKLLKDARDNYNILRSQMKKLRNSEVIQFNPKEEVLIYNNIDILLSTQLKRFGLDNSEIQRIEDSWKPIVRKTNVNLYHVTDMFKSQKDYMISVKLAYTNRVKTNPPKCPVNKNILENIDYLNETHVKAMLYLNAKNLDPSKELSIVAYDIDKKIKELYSYGRLNDRDVYIIDGLRFGLTDYAIAKELGLKRNSVVMAIKKIVNRITDSFYNDMFDLYYLNERKGKYKKCSRCGEVKLIREFAKNGNRLRSNCKKCK